MPKSSFGFSGRNGRRGGGTVTVIEQQVKRNHARTAKVTFFVLLPVVGLLTATIAAYYLPPIAAFLLGILIGALVGAVAGAFIIAWPVLRVIWWWTPEILGVLAVGLAWVNLVDLLNPVLAGLVFAIPAAIIGLIPQPRRLVVAFGWCLISRHRLRACFNEFIISNRTGSLPLILWAKPLPVGERIWVWLRPGLSLTQLTGNLDRIAVACWANTVTVEQASGSNAAFVRFDIKRRDALSGVITSPLVDLVDPDTPASSAPVPAVIPTALDLDDIPAEDLAPATKPAPKRTKAPAPAAAAASSGSDLDDWL
ncbi:hypothetical protein ABGB12_17110 [Actinocorallia sp. B10E7]|uniref:hypothetical protein n=1 Tax=Actinocorallia sp. B10E7 TaxID=3153558 RepID=UPI00325E7A5E